MESRIFFILLRSKLNLLVDIMYRLYSNIIKAIVLIAKLHYLGLNKCKLISWLVNESKKFRYLKKEDNRKCVVMYNDTKLLHGNIKIDYT